MVITIKIASVICEFNPFHNGHKFLIEKIKENYADIVVCIMSGNFTQRGDISIVDKYEKTLTALSNGADLVVELPCAFANSGASIFSDRGVQIAKVLNSDFLCFGTENFSIDDINFYKNAIRDEEIKNKVKEKIKNGLYYPKALEESLYECKNINTEKIKLPNNILALEYSISCEKYNITPISINRIGASHDSDITSECFASSSYIRKLIKHKEDYSYYSPTKISNPVFIEDIENIIVYKLKSMTKSDLKNLAEVNEGLENRIYEFARKYSTLNEILENVKTKRYIMSKLRRISINALLGITKEIQNSSNKYIRVLGMNNKGMSLLNNVSLPLITNVKSSSDSLTPNAKNIFNIDTFSSEVYSVAKKETINDYNMGIIKI